MKSLFRRTLPALFAALVLVGCGSVKEQAEPQNDGSQALVQVINRNWLSMEIYVIGQSQRVRLGRVGTGKTQRFIIPSHLITGATPLRFTMESSGASPTTLSESFVVAPGEEIILVIPNTR